MRIAILFDTYLNNRKGLFNAIVNRIKNLIVVSDACSIDLYCMQARPAGLNRLRNNQQNQRHVRTFSTDGLTFHIIWYKRYLLDDLFANSFHHPPFLFRKWAKRNLSYFSSYDIITAHSTGCGEMARLINKKYGIPYFVTWHGTDIHTTPFKSQSFMNYTARILEGASCNFFVSRALRDIARGLGVVFRSEILYNGVSDDFKRFSKSKKDELKKKNGVTDSKVVAFVGNLVPVKNVTSLPKIFSEVKKKYSGFVSFWIIGDGFQRELVEMGMKENCIDCTFWGNRLPSEIPEIMNCIDVLVLPSINEGMGLVTVEALACGANVVGSNVGGIPEVIGDDNSFALDADFVTNISDRVVYFLTNDVQQTVNKKFSWELTAMKEFRIYKELLS